jgi:sulfide dehydrogenase cytochrome subunit
MRQESEGEARMSANYPAVAATLLGLALLSAQPSFANGVCADCHGKDGASTESDVPIIGGVSEAYLNDTMAAYRDSKRPCAESAYRAGDKKRPKTDMCKIAAKLSAEEIAKESKEYAGKPFVRAKQKFDAAKAAAGKKVHDTACEAGRRARPVLRT